MSYRRWNEKEMIEAVNKIDGFKYMSNKKYRIVRKKSNLELPSPSTLTKHFGGWSNMKNELFNLDPVRLTETWPKKRCIEVLEENPEIEYMTLEQYNNFRKNAKIELPSKQTITDKLGRWLEMKSKIYGSDCSFRNHISQFCRDCLYFGECEYNYDLESCKWYEEE